jgi:plasmid rolling circle replication initiator protein Rep
MGKQDVPPSENPMVFLSDVSPRDKSWDEHRTNASLVAQLYKEAGIDRRSDRMNECARQLCFALEARDEGELILRLKSARFCRQRLCPVCQSRRALMWRARFIKGLPPILQAYPGYRWIFVTLTVRNCHLKDLRATIRGMSKGWDKFAKYKDFPGLGWIRTLEVTRNPETREAHPHYHILMMVKPSYFKSKAYLSNQRWRELWAKAMVIDYLPVTHVKVVKPKTDDSHPLIRGILETVKYGVKESDLIADSEWLAGLTTQMDKLKTVALGGIIKNYLKESEPEDLIHTDEDDIDIQLLKDFPELVFDWKAHINRYVKR